MEQSRPYHHGNLRQALLDQAMVALRDGGIDELSLRELARAVGVHRPRGGREYASPVHWSRPRSRRPCRDE